MNVGILLLIIENFLVVVLLISKWKDLLQKFRPNWFIEGRIHHRTGEVSDIIKLKDKKNPDIIVFNKFHYRGGLTNKIKNGSKAYEWNEEVKDPINVGLEEMTYNKNPKLDAKREEIKYADLFQEDLPFLDKLMQMAMPFIVGIVVGVLIATLEAKGG